MLFSPTKRHLLSRLPDRLPTYRVPRRSPYSHIAHIGAGESDDPVHFGASLVERIAETPGQEVASRSFSNFRCFAPDHTPGQFESDLRAAIHTARDCGVMLRSLAVPENALPGEHRSVARQLGFSAYRAHAGPWPYDADPPSDPVGTVSRIRNWVATVDSVLPLTGTRCVRRDDPITSPPVDIPATRRLRPPVGSRRWISEVQLRRLFWELDCAVKTGRIFHVWWKIRDLGGNPSISFDALHRLFDRVDGWRRLNRLQSATMHEVAIGPRPDLPTHSNSTSSRRRTTSP